MTVVTCHQIDDTRVEHVGVIPTLSPLALLDLNRLIVDSEAMAATLPDSCDFTSETAKKWDSITVEGAFDALRGVRDRESVAWVCCVHSPFMWGAVDLLANYSCFHRGRGARAEWVRTSGWCHNAKEAYLNGMKSILCSHPSEVSLLYWLFYIKSGRKRIRRRGV